MNREELIKKWLDNNLNTEEQKAFEQLEDYNKLIQMDNALKDFKAPKFSVDETYKTLQPKLKSSSTKFNRWLKPLLKLAAVLVIGITINYYTSAIDTKVDTSIAQKTSIELPDDSSVKLNANSSIAFNESKWQDNRVVKLQGEAFFKVAKGEKFDVITNDGIVAVLGTKFNVKQRENYFEVTCYEGLVAVTHSDKTVELKPGYTFQIIDGKLLANEKENTTQPSWLRDESSFKSVPLKYVISEFENQYNLKVSSGDIDTSRLFTGSFTHKNLDLALQSVTIPLNLSYSKSGKSILLKRE
ncbi:FecR domain-containing protein [uncultured Winogradskyella sp.]|uniref:FecR family protein n=1 Tax=uncultured Winogradskyella sp. TaxID=395353 RepID=UPI0026396D6F|nr:FecR domain-containing protein [uncultured Winogradskyella sp.]